MSAVHGGSAANVATGAPTVPVENITRWHAAIADELRAAFEAVLPGER